MNHTSGSEFPPLFGGLEAVGPEIAACGFLFIILFVFIIELAFRALESVTDGSIFAEMVYFSNTN